MQKIKEIAEKIQRGQGLVSTIGKLKIHLIHI